MLTLGGLSKATTGDEVSNVVSPAHHIIDCVADYQYQVSSPVSVDSALGVADEAPWRYAVHPWQAVRSVTRHAYDDTSPVMQITGTEY